MLNKAILSAAAASMGAMFFDQKGGTARDFGPVARPAGGLRLVAVPPERLEMYLAGRRPDRRCFGAVDSKGRKVRPTLIYSTFVNYSKIYKVAGVGHRECVRRCPGFYEKAEA